MQQLSNRPGLGFSRFLPFINRAAQGEILKRSPDDFRKKLFFLIEYIPYRIPQRGFQGFFI